MAVKASAHITLNSVVDIAAYYRYYLLQSSTLSAPSVPTTNPPDGSWGDVEPSYTEGSTNSLYFVDLTVFSDGTWSYSDVSLSSSYEAAKEAYNKATAAQNTASTAQDTADNAQDATNNLAERVNMAEININAIDGHISNLVVDANGQSLMTQTGSGWTFSTKSIDETLSTTSDALSSLQQSIGEWNLDGTVVSNINSLLSVVGDHGDTLNWVTIGEIDVDGDGSTEPCIELGESDSIYKLVITNKAIYFREGAAAPTKIQDNTLVTNNVEVENELRQTHPSVSGYWMWLVRSNGNYGLTWKGV